MSNGETLQKTMIEASRDYEKLPAWVKAETTRTPSVSVERTVRPTSSTTGRRSFVIEKSSTGHFRFNLRAGNNEIILTSESYEAKAGAENGIESVRKLSQDDDRFKRKTARDGSPYFVLTTATGEVIGTSELYSSVAAMENGIKSVAANAPVSVLVDKT